MKAYGCGAFLVVDRGGLFLHCHKCVSYCSIIHYLLIQIFINTVLVEYQDPEIENKSHSTCPHITSDSVIFMAPEDLTEPTC